MNADHIGATLLMVLALIGVLLWLTGWVDDENDGTVDEHGIRRVPGEEPSEVGLP